LWALDFLGDFLITSMKRTNIITYVRWSSQEQTEGDSRNRQIQAAKRWCEKEGYTLPDENIVIDEGVSAFRGDNITKGNLGKLWEALKSREIDPSNTILLTEDFDRLSRANPDESMGVIRLVQNYDLILVTLNDGKVYKRDTAYELENYLVASLKMALANIESRKKADRVGKAWANKRLSLGQKHYTKKRPHWIGYDDKDKKFYPIEDRVTIVQQIFNYYLKGYGAAWITGWLNKNKIQPWGTKRCGLKRADDLDHKGKFYHASADCWLISYVKKILSNRATFGELTPFTKRGLTKRTQAGDPIENYYPPAIDKETFELAQLYRSKRHLKVGRQSRGNGNLFPTLCRCGFCGSSMHFVTKNAARDEVYLVCSKARYNGGCSYISFPYREFETSFFRHVRKIPFTEFGRGKERLAELRTAQLHKEAALASIDKRIENLTQAIELCPKEDLQSLINRQAERQRERNLLNNQLSQLMQEMADLRGFDENSRTVTSLLEDEGMKEYLTNPELRHHLKEAIAKMVKQIEIFPAYNLDPKLRATRHFVVKFVDGTTQKCLGTGESEMIYSNDKNHEASWSPTFAQEYLTLLPSLSGLDSGKTEQTFMQPKAEGAS